MHVNSLNRTFYGIETANRNKTEIINLVLIVPFMELKLDPTVIHDSGVTCLNRTFYGIETSLTD